MVLVSDKPISPIVLAGLIVMIMHFLHAGRKRVTLPGAEESMSTTVDFMRDCSKDTGFIQPVHDGVRRGFVDGLRLGLLATCPAPSVHGSVLACVPGRRVFASCDSAGCPAPPHSTSMAAAGHQET